MRSIGSRDCWSTRPSADPVKATPFNAEKNQMGTNELALAQGLKDTGETIAGWRSERWRVVGSWTVLSAAIAVGLLLAVYAVGRLSTPDVTSLVVIGVNRAPSLDMVGVILFRNSLVLALHALACVAGFIAGSALPLQATNKTGLWRTVHERAGPLAILFVVCATGFSLLTQAYFLGSQAATIAAQLGLGLAPFLAVIATHAIPELTALFLPLAAWIIASRRGDWHKLFAATFVTVGIAVPVLVLTALQEVYVTPRLLGLLIGP